jgi:flagellar hook-associated protein 2
MAGIQLSGLASGFDWKSTVTQLMAIERVPQDNLKKQQAAAQKLQAAYDTLKTNLNALKTAASALSTSFTGSPRAVSVTSGDGVTSASDASASTSSGAALGTYRIDVKSLPKASTGLGGAVLIPSETKAKSLKLSDYGVTEGTVTVNGTQYTISNADLSKTIGDVFNGGNLILPPSADPLDPASAVSGVTTSFNAATSAVELTGSSLAMGGPGDTSNILRALGLSGVSLEVVASAASGSNSLTVSDSGFTVGMEVSAPWLPSGTTIASVGAPSGGNVVVGLSNPITASVAAGDTANVNKYTQTIPQSVLATVKLEELKGFTGAFDTELRINGASVGTVSSSSTLGAVVSQINSASGAGVSATIDPSTGRLRLTSNISGDYAISVTVGSAATALGLDTLAASVTKGSGTRFTVAVNGGTASQVYSSTTGEIDLSKYGYGSTRITPSATGVFSVKVTANASDGRAKINSLISAYNSLKQMLDDSTKVTTGADGKVTASVFSNRGDINSLLSNIRSRVYSEVKATGLSTQYNTMGKIGIGFDRNGTMSVVDSAKLDAALTDNPSAIDTLLNAGSSGLSLTLKDQVSDDSFQVTDPGLVKGQGVSASWLPTGTKITDFYADPDVAGRYRVKVSNSITGGYGSPATYTYSTSEQGIVTRLVNLMSSLTGTGGLVSSATTAITSQTKRLQTQINALDRSLAQQQAALEASFIAMERAQSKYNSMSSQIASAFNSNK